MTLGSAIRYITAVKVRHRRNQNELADQPRNWKGVGAIEVRVQSCEVIVTSGCRTAATGMMAPLAVHELVMIHDCANGLGARGV